MRSILSVDAYQQMADNCSRQGKTLAPLRSISSQPCMSVTGQPLNFSGLLVTQFSLPGCDYSYEVEFMVCSNLLQPLKCILGWDFIVAHKLQLSVLGGSYGLVGPHGCTPLTPWASPSGTLSTCSAPSRTPREEPPPCFTQSTSQGPVKLALVDSFSIPGRSECLLVAKTPRGYSNQLGMISPREKSDHCSYIIASTLNIASDGKVSVRVMNPSDSPIQLYKGQKIAQFQPVFESISIPTQLPSSQICGSINNMSVMEPETLKELEAAINPQLPPNDKQALLNTLLSFPDVFNNGLGHTTVTDHKIDTGDSPPIRQYPRRLPYQFRGEVDKQVTEMLSQNVIQRSTSPWASPVVLVRKKDGTYRFCIDYRKLNLVTKQNANPLPRVDDLLDALNGYSIFSTLDLRSGYWQVSMCPEDREKTAFMTPHGLFEFLRMPYGLSTAPATFSRAISIVLSGLTYEMCLCYFDDVIIFSKDMQQHCERLSTVLQRFRSQNLRVKASKCSFGCDNVVYLGHSVSKYGIHTDPSKIKAIQDLAPPSTLEELRSFLGLAGYYRRFIPRFATIASPLTALTNKGVQFVWTEHTESAFQHLKTCLCSAPILAYPNFDKPFILQTDASDVGLGAVLTQLDKSGHERVISYASKTLTDRERNYTAMEKEALAVVFATGHFRVYLLGRKFQLMTDNRALKWLHTIQPKGRIARWIMDLQEFDFTVSHRPGASNQNADALSRLNHQTSALHNNTLCNSSAPSASFFVGLVPDCDLFSAQREDAAISKIIEMKEKGFPRPPPFVWKDNRLLSCYWYCWDQLFLQNGLLMKSHKASAPFPQNTVVIPQGLINIVLRNLHSSSSGGHMGINRTTARARERFFWPRMREAVQKFIQNCSECSQIKQDPSLTKAPLKQIEVSEPFVFWAMDYMGPIKETARGNKHILVLMDHFTKWCEAFPTKDQRASTVAQILVSRVFSRFGPPTVLHSDQGRNFESILMHEIYNLMGIKKTRTTAYHPQCDGLVERQNRTLQSILSAFVSEHSTDWDEWLDQAVFAYNTSVHESTGLSPYELIFGRPARMPIEVELGVPLRNPSSQSDYSQSLRKALLHSNELAQRNLNNARSRQASQYNNKSKKDWEPLEPGQTVWLWRPKHWKFGKKWTGPYKIQSRDGVNYRVASTKGNTLIAHHNILKPCPVPIDKGTPFCPTHETPGITIVGKDEEGLAAGEPMGGRGGTARPPFLRQVINPPTRFGNAITH